MSEKKKNNFDLIAFYNLLSGCGLLHKVQATENWAFNRHMPDLPAHGSMGGLAAPKPAGCVPTRSTPVWPTAPGQWAKNMPETGAGGNGHWKLVQPFLPWLGVPGKSWMLSPPHGNTKKHQTCSPQEVCNWLPAVWQLRNQLHPFWLGFMEKP